MRAAFIRTLIELAQSDPRIYLLTGDLGFMALEPFAERFPDRFINAGVAEQNMVGVATGLAQAGMIPFVYSIATFASMRPYEFIRNGPILHRLPVRIVGVGGGFEYAHNGLSHFALEDIAVMRTQPALNVVAPADWRQAENALRQTWNLDGPVYYRCGKDDKSLVPDLEGRFGVNDLQIVHQGDDALVLSMGGIAVQAAEAVAQLSGKGIRCTHAVISHVNPAPAAALTALLARFATVVSIEAHYATGGLFSLVAETIASGGLHCRLSRCAVERLPDGFSGDIDYMHQRYGLSAPQIGERIKDAVLGERIACSTR